MSLPLWTLYALGAAFLAALIPLVQERGRADPLALAFGIKITVACVLLPLALWKGLPHEPRFYLGLGLTGALWCVSDVYYFSTVRQVGAGPVSRLLPGMMVPGFILWLIVNPHLVDVYMETPWRSTGIAACVAASAFCAAHLTRCQVTRQTFKLLWPTCLGAIVGPTAAKLILDSAPAAQAPYTYSFVEALLMLAMWSLYGLIRPRTGRIILAGLRHAPVRRAAFLIGCLSAGSLVLKMQGFATVEHPSYITVLMYTDVLWIIGIYRLLGRRETARIAPGLGLAACAAALVLLKSL